MAIFSIGDRIPCVGKDVWVAETAFVSGDVNLGERVSVWPNASIRGDIEPISIEEGSNVQDGAVIHTDFGFACRIGKNVTVGHAAVLHGCTIGDGSLIGMGATVLNGSVIGSGSIVGAGALVTQNKTFPDNSLIVGAPARVVRTLTDDDRAAILQNAQHYCETADLYRLTAKRIDQ